MPADDQDEIPQDALNHPGAIKINVQGAFIVDQEPSESPIIEAADGVEYKHDNRDIRLPNHKAAVSHIAVDIGGSLAKLVYFSPEPDNEQLGGRLNFVKVETQDFEQCIQLMHRLQQRHRLNGTKPKDLCVMATGGGAFKYYDKIREALGVEVKREDEMACLIMGEKMRSSGVFSVANSVPAGLDFFITEIPSEIFTYTSKPPHVNEIDPNPMSFLPARLPSQIYPYLLVNIGSGVSMIKVSGPHDYQRIGGTSLGGGTLWGLLSLITGARSFDDMLALAAKGNNTAVDMLVGDIYGTGYTKLGMRSDMIASSFGKVYRMKKEAEREAEDGGWLANGDNSSTAGDEHAARSFRPEDVSRSLLYAVSYNIGQIAYLQSCKHNLENIYFGGSFIRGHRQTMNTLSFAIDFWSNGEKQAYFLRHEGYLGAVGAFLKRQPKNWGRRNSFETEEVGGLKRWLSSERAAVPDEAL
ncbi:MAG: hypothetical protein Q9162_003173 [Coniocarpon cinnabarinum]